MNTITKSITVSRVYILQKYCLCLAEFGLQKEGAYLRERQFESIQTDPPEQDP